GDRIPPGSTRRGAPKWIPPAIRPRDRLDHRPSRLEDGRALHQSRSGLQAGTVGRREAAAGRRGGEGQGRRAGVAGRREEGRMTDSIQITARDDKPSWTKTRGGLTLSVRMGRFALPYHHDEFRARFSERDIRFVINDASGRVVAKGTFEEWRQDSTDPTGIDGFRFALENISNEWAKLSDVIFYNWSGEDEIAAIPFDH